MYIYFGLWENRFFTSHLPRMYEVREVGRTKLCFSLHSMHRKILGSFVKSEEFGPTRLSGSFSFRFCGTPQCTEQQSEKNKTSSIYFSKLSKALKSSKSSFCEDSAAKNIQNCKKKCANSCFHHRFHFSGFNMWKPKKSPFASQNLLSWHSENSSLLEFEFWVELMKIELNWKLKNKKHPRCPVFHLPYPSSGRLWSFFVSMVGPTIKRSTVPHEKWLTQTATKIWVHGAALTLNRALSKQSIQRTKHQSWTKTTSTETWTSWFSSSFPLTTFRSLSGTMSLFKFDIVLNNIHEMSHSGWSWCLGIKEVSEEDPDVTKLSRKNF